jgi:hypothetical protein
MRIDEIAKIVRDTYNPDLQREIRTTKEAHSKITCLEEKIEKLSNIIRRMSVERNGMRKAINQQIEALRKKNAKKKKKEQDKLLAVELLTKSPEWLYNFRGIPYPEGYVPWAHLDE